MGIYRLFKYVLMQEAACSVNDVDNMLSLNNIWCHNVGVIYFDAVVSINFHS